MSLTVPAKMIEQARQSKIQERDFVTVIRTSLPHAWKIVEGLVAKRDSSENALEMYGTGPMDDQTRGELLRMLAGTAIRRATERHFGIQLLFQNCHNVAVVQRGQEDSAEVLDFSSINSQILNQRPDITAC